MKRQIFLYLFLFAMLYIVFQYMNAKKAYAKMQDLEEEVVTLRKENDILTRNANDSDDYFSLLDNDAAYSFYADQGMSVQEVAAKIKDEIIGKNKANDDNKLVPFSGMEGPMRVNHIKILNHKWVIADFTDGVYWGELFLKYEITDDGEIHFETIESFLYPRKR